MRKLPLFKRTHELYKRLGDLFSFGKIASISGVSTDTADDWARPVESDEFPTGTGKRNTTDTVLRQIRLAHTEDAGLARKWAQMFCEYVEYLDELSGVERASFEGSLCQIIGESAKEHLDIVLYVMNESNPDHERLQSEIGEAIAKLNELAACVKEQAKNEVKTDYRRSAAQITAKGFTN